MRFSLLMSVYIKEKPEYLSEALKSIWHDQTLKPNQVVLVKDGPLTYELDCCVAYWSAELGDVLSIVSLPRNVGLGSALNEGLKRCRYDLVARMDSDDISMPQRFEKQVAFMRNNPNVVAASAFTEEFDEYGKSAFVRTLPERHDDIVKFSKKRCPLTHPATIYRRESILRVGGYPPFFPEDWALWALLIVNDLSLANIPEVLLKMRTPRDFIYRRGFSFLIGEIQLFGYQKKIGFLTFSEYLLNLAIRISIRLPPAFIRRSLYRIGR